MKFSGALTLALSLASYCGCAQRLQGYFETVLKDVGFESDLLWFEGTRFFTRTSIAWARSKARGLLRSLAAG